MNVEDIDPAEIARDPAVKVDHLDALFLDFGVEKAIVWIPLLVGKSRPSYDFHFFISTEELPLVQSIH